MEPSANMHLEPASSSSPSWRRGARFFAALAVVLAVMWGETWTIERSAEFIAPPTAQSSGPDVAFGHRCAANAVPVATLH